jgi:DNA-binding NarL/FixJ family response regulator
MVLNSLNIDVQIISAHSLYHAYSILLNPELSNLSLAILDFSMTEYLPYNLKTGGDIAQVIRLKFPAAKIIFISGLLNSLELESLIKNSEPEGIIEKADIEFRDLSTIFLKIIEGENFYSTSIQERIKENQSKYFFLDYLNLRIIQLISQGVTTKNLPKYLPISLSAIHKRKSKIKIMLNIENSSTEILINECKRLGLI